VKALAAEYDRALAEERDRFQKRHGEVFPDDRAPDHQAARNELEQIARQRRQLKLFDRDERFEELERSEKARLEELARIREHYDALRRQLSAERERIVTHLLPKRYALRGTCQLYPLPSRSALPTSGVINEPVVGLPQARRVTALAVRLQKYFPGTPDPLDDHIAERLRAVLTRLESNREEGEAQRQMLDVTLERVCDLTSGWTRGAQVDPRWSQRVATGESVRPRRIWQGPHGALLPVFVDDEPRLGIGRGRRVLSELLNGYEPGTSGSRSLPIIATATCVCRPRLRRLGRMG